MEGKLSGSWSGKFTFLDALDYTHSMLLSSLYRSYCIWLSRQSVLLLQLFSQQQQRNVFFFWNLYFLELCSDKLKSQHILPVQNTRHCKLSLYLIKETSRIHFTKPCCQLKVVVASPTGVFSPHFLR